MSFIVSLFPSPSLKPIMSFIVPLHPTLPKKQSLSFIVSPSPELTHHEIYCIPLTHPLHWNLAIMSFIVSHVSLPLHLTLLE